MRRGAVGAILGFLSAVGPAWAADPVAVPIATTVTTTVLVPNETGAPLSRLVLPGQAEGNGPAPTLPPRWLLPRADAATLAAEQAQFDAALQLRFGKLSLPPQGFDRDIVPLAAGQDWQRLQRRVDETIGTEKIALP